MPILVLIRHAKAEPYAESDLQRSLSVVGKRQCAVVANRLHGILPELQSAVVSPARRTIQTWSEITRMVAVEIPVQIASEIYEGSDAKLLELVRSLPVGSHAIVGHNPGIALLASKLARDLHEAQRDFIRSYPTSGVCILESDAEWSNWQPGSVRVMDTFAAPEC